MEFIEDKRFQNKKNLLIRFMIRLFQIIMIPFSIVGSLIDYADDFGD